MAGRASDPAFPLATAAMDWIPTGPGKSFRPLRFEAGGWSELIRLEPGTGVPLHRHSGEVHAYCLTGSREILGTGEIAGPGSYVHEPGGTIDAWQAVGDQPCVLHLKVAGAIDYLDSDGQVFDIADATTRRRAYLDWCAEHGTEPDERILGGS